MGDAILVGDLHSAARRHRKAATVRAERAWLLDGEPAQLAVDPVVVAVPAIVDAAVRPAKAHMGGDANMLGTLPAVGAGGGVPQGEDLHLDPHHQGYPKDRAAGVGTALRNVAV